MGLQQILGTTDWTYVGRWISDNYVNNEDEKKRRRDASKRDALYENKGDEYIDALIQRAFKSELTKKQRSDLIQWAKWNNVTARIVREKATVYSEPSKRKVGEGDETYQNFLNAVQQDEAMRELDHKLELHEDVWVQYRVRELEDGTREPVLDIISPAMFWAVSYPDDPTRLAAIVVDQTPDWKNARKTEPHYRVWCYGQTFQLDGECRVITASVEEIPFGWTGVLATTRAPSLKGCLINATAYADVIAAHEAVWFQGVLLLKESKSATRQLYHSGDMSAAALGQPSDTETDVVLPEGVTTQAVDRGNDLSQYRDNSDHILERAGANHGLPPSVLHHQDSSSGEEIMLRRLPLRELRRKRILVMRRTERQIANIQSTVNAKDLSEFSFSTDGWSMDFGEVQQPMSELESVQVYEKKKQLLLTDQVEEEMRRNPDLKTPEVAFQVLKDRALNQLKVLQVMQPLSALDGGLRTMPGDPEGEENGQDGKFSPDNGRPTDEEQLQ